MDWVKMVGSLLSDAINSKALDIAGASAAIGYTKASTEFVTKILAYITCKAEGVDISNADRVEAQIKTAITLALQDIKGVQ